MGGKVLGGGGEGTIDTEGLESEYPQKVIRG